MTPRAPDWQVEGRDWPLRQYSRFLVRGALRWHVQVMGSGPPVLLLHGTGAGTHSFRDVMPLLAEHFQVLAPDLPGHAFTTAGPVFHPSIAGMSAALVDLLDAMGVAPEIVVAHSAGAAVMAHMTLEGLIRPRMLVGLAAALVALRGPNVYLAPAVARLMAQSRLAAGVISLQARNAQNVTRLVRSTGSILDDRGVEFYRRLAMCPGHVAGVLAMLAAWDLAPLEARLPRLETPLLLLAGERDGIIPLQHQRRLARHTKNARLRVVQRAGHLLHEERPAFISQLLLQETAAGQPLGGSGVVH